jgi:hypothetical protein
MDKRRYDIPYGRRFWLIMFGVLICFVIFLTLVPPMKPVEMIKLSSTSRQYSDPNQPDMPSEAAAAQSKPTLATNPSVNAVTEAAVKMGILSCVSRINQVASFLTANVKSGVYIFKPKAQPDKHVFSTSFELLRPDDSTLYASASFFPNQDAVYDTVEYVNIGSEELEKTVFKNLKRVSVLKKNIILLNGGNVKVFLMPAGSGTVVIKKEIIP